MIQPCETLDLFLRFDCTDEFLRLIVCIYIRKMSALADEKPKKVPDKYVDGQKIITIPVLGYEVKEKTYILVMELVLSSMAIFSTMTAYIAFVKLKACASDVTNIVDSWNATPISQVKWQTTPCVSPWMQVNPLDGFVGKESGLGCVCSSGARYKLSGTGTTQYKPALSGPEPCLTNQTSSASTQYQCYDVMKGSIPSFPMKKWKNTYQCYATGTGTGAAGVPFVNAFGQTAVSKGACALGTHLCGSADNDRSFCEPDTTIGCPVNWMGSNALGVLAQFNNPTGFTSANSGFTPVSIGSGTSYSIDTTEYQQIGYNTKVNVAQNWSPMPLVEMGMSVGLPCYGVDNPITSKAKTTTASNTKMGTATTSPVNLMVGLPDSCSSTIVPSTDARYAAADYYSIGNLAYENYLLNPNNACAKDTSGNAVTDINNVPNYNVYASASSCQTAAAGDLPNSCLTKTLPQGITNTFTLTCATGDSYCNQAKTQTKCGLWQSLMSQTDNVGVFMKSQIYWKPDCVADKVAVKDSEKKLSNSMKVQTALVIMNTIANVILIGLGFRIAYLCYINRDKPTSTYSDLEHIWKPRITTAASILKIPIVIATVASTGAIKSFFVSLSAGKCAGTTPASASAITNETFDQLGTQLPSIFTANVFVLLLDLVTFVPAVYAYVSHFCAYDDADSDILGGGMASKDETELSKVPPPPPAPSGL